MSRLIRNAQPTWKPECLLFHEYRTLLLFCLLYQIGKTSAIVQKELIIQTNITIMSIKIKVKQKKSKNMVDKRRRLC